MQAEHSTGRKKRFIARPFAPSQKKSSNDSSYEKEGLSAAQKTRLHRFTSTCTLHAVNSAKRMSNTILSAIVAVCCLAGIFSFFTVGTGISYGGIRIAVANSEEAFLRALSEADDYAESCGITNPPINFTTSPVFTLRTEILSENDLRDKILLSTGLFSEACRVSIGNIKIFTAESNSAAYSAVNEFISTYSMNGDASLTAKPEYKHCVVPKSEVSDKKECIRLLETNECINVVSVVNTTTSKEVPFDTQVENDASLYIGETVTVTEGKNGNMQIYEETVYENGQTHSTHITAEKLTATPVSRVVRVGTKYKNVLESGLNLPLQGVLSSPFGERWGKNHEGIDIAVVEGTPVKSAECGTVTYVSENAGGYGKFIRIDHGYGVETAYAHLNEIHVSAGQSVNAGTVIGLSGNTGRSTGPHLHFEVICNDIPVNPYDHLKN